MMDIPAVRPRFAPRQVGPHMRTHLFVQSLSHTGAKQTWAAPLKDGLFAAFMDIMEYHELMEFMDIIE